jgi:NADPH2:quinone reductase
MKAVCYTEERSLEVREVPTPREPAPGHVLVNIDSASIMHGDKFFLKHPLPNGSWATARHDIYGSNGGGTIVAIGAGVPERYLDQKVAIYKALKPSGEATGLWCETAQVPFETCLILPDTLRVRDYNGSLANILTIYAFLDQAKLEGHRGIIVTAGSSATGLIAAALTRRQGIPAIFLVRSTASRAKLIDQGIENVLLTTEGDFQEQLRDLADRLDATAVFDGVGGELLGRVVSALPTGGTAYVAGIMVHRRPQYYHPWTSWQKTSPSSVSPSSKQRCCWILTSSLPPPWILKRSSTIRCLLQEWAKSSAFTRLTKQWSTTRQQGSGPCWSPTEESKGRNSDFHPARVASAEARRISQCCHAGTRSLGCSWFDWP